MVCYGASRSGMIRFGMAWPGGFERNWACYGVVRSGKAGHDPVWRGYFKGRTFSVRPVDTHSDGSPVLARRVGTWYGAVGYGKAKLGRGMVWSGLTRRGE